MKREAKLRAVTSPDAPRAVREVDHQAIVNAILAHLPLDIGSTEDDPILINVDNIDGALAGIEPLLLQLEGESGRNVDPYFEALRSLTDRIRRASHSLRCTAALVDAGELGGRPSSFKHAK